MKTHKVKEIGTSEYTECGLRHINNGIPITQDGEVTCKKCLEAIELSQSRGKQNKCL